MGNPQSGSAAPENNAANNTGNPKPLPKPTRRTQQRYRVFAQVTDYLMADVWAADVDDAYRIAKGLNVLHYRDMAGDRRIDTIRLIDEEDIRLEPFSPVN